MANPHNIAGQGFHTNPERINKSGRPKGLRNRSTIAKMILQSHMSLNRLPDEVQGQLRELMSSLGIDPEKNESEIYLTVAQFLTGIMGDPKSYNALMDSAYGKATQYIETTEVKSIEYDFTKLTSDEFNRLNEIESERAQLLAKCTPTDSEIQSGE